MTIYASNYDRSRYYKAADLKSERKLRIKDVSVEQIGTGADQQEKLVVWFHNEDQGLPLNRTNNRILRDAFGDDVAGWAGQAVVVFPTTADFRGRLVPAIRVRIPAPSEKAAAAVTKESRRTAKPKQQEEDEIEEALKRKGDDFDDDIDDV